MERKLHFKRSQVTFVRPTDTIPVQGVAASSAQTVLPFAGLNNAYGVAVDGTGDVYVADSDNNRVLKLAAGATQQSVVPFTGLNEPRGVAVDASGAVYVTNGDRVVKLRQH